MEETTDLTTDAWGRPKSIKDHSLFHALFTYDVPDRIWEEAAMDDLSIYTPLAITGTKAKSVNGMLELSSGTTQNNGASLIGKRHPRYQPNRGHLYSSSMFLPNPESDGTRKFGLSCGCLSDTRRSGVYFELEGDGTDWKLYAVLKSYGVIKERTDITKNIPGSIDISKGNLFDIQYQWRGVGDYFFFLGQELVHVMNRVSKNDDLSLWNPALASGFEIFTRTTTEMIMRCGCVDITSEGGAGDSRQFASISTGEDLLTVTTTGTAVLALKIPRTLIYNSVEAVNTRDLIASRLVSWTKDEAAVQVYVARDTNLTALEARADNADESIGWKSLPDSTAYYMIGGTTSNLDSDFQADKSNMQLLLNEWEELEKKNNVINPDQENAPFYLTAGDYLVVVVKPIGANKLSASTLYLSEEIYR